MPELAISVKKNNNDSITIWCDNNDDVQVWITALIVMLHGKSSLLSTHQCALDIIMPARGGQLLQNISAPKELDSVQAKVYYIKIDQTAVSPLIKW